MVAVPRPTAILAALRLLAKQRGAADDALAVRRSAEHGKVRTNRVHQALVHATLGHRQRALHDVVGVRIRQEPSKVRARRELKNCTILRLLERLVAGELQTFLHNIGRKFLR